MATAPKKDAKDKAPEVMAFYTPAASKGPVVEMFINAPVEGKRIPEFGGTVDGQRVAMRVRKGPKGGFMSVTKSVKTGEKDENGKAIYEEKQVGTARVNSRENGSPLLVVNMDGREDAIFASVRKAVPMDLLQRAGFDLEAAERKRAEAASKVANEEGSKKKAAPKA